MYVWAQATTRLDTHTRMHARTVTLQALQISQLTRKHASASLITVIVRHLLLNEFQHLISISRFQVEWHTPVLCHFGFISCRLNVCGVRVMSVKHTETDSKDTICLLYLICR